jgi:asparagine synthase (glutamine-hydrolysing)
MCGIAGWFGPKRDWSAELLREGLSCRGPDGSGVYDGPGAVLVHTRLAIIGLGETGAQPMVHRKDGVAEKSEDILVFNGEIYNYREFGGEEALSDAQVLMTMLEREGEDCLPKLAGMFAFAFYRSETGDALLARDAFGIKPLYYRIDGETLAFASDSRLLRRSDDRIDATALRDFFLWGSVPEPATITSEIRQVPAGHFLRWKNRRVEVVRWYKPDLRKHRTMPRDEAVRRTRSALEESMLRHLVSDVPVGVFLSGGIDSTAVLALARGVLGPAAEIRTFSVGFEDPSFDESDASRRTAGHFGARHTEWRMTSKEGAEEIEAYLSAVDQPTIDGFNTWCVSKLARREGMKVVLSGLGGDEWFAGYASFTRVPLLHSIHCRFPSFFRRAVASILERNDAGSPWRRLASFLRGGGSWLEAFHAQRGIFDPDEAAALAKFLCGEEPPALEWNNTGALPDEPGEIAGWLEVTRYMRNQLLRDSDVFSMAHGLELRVPLVDIRLAEALLSLPPALRLQNGKKLLLDAVPEIPEWIRSRPKQGFRFPFQQWMQGSFGDMLREVEIASPVASGTWYRTWALAAARRAVRR